jgi:hypothetical protein
MMEYIVVATLTGLIIGAFWKPRVVIYQQIRKRFPWPIRWIFSIGYFAAAYVMAIYIAPFTYELVSYFYEWYEKGAMP